MSAYLKELNKEQIKAAKSSSPFIEILAGPGTGKTKTLVARIRFLLEKKIKPGQILAITFTRKAADEISRRLGNRKVFTGTFHSLALLILKEAGIEPEIIPEQKRLLLIKKLRQDKALEVGISALTARELGLIISRSKSSNIVPANYKVLVNLYQLLLKKEKLSDFDDLLLDAYEQLKTSAELQQKFSSRFSHLLVDEFQDTNEIQYKLLKELDAQNIFIIGDPLQAIYAFRGSDSSIFEKFENDFKPERIVLNKNYRSGLKIVAAAYSLFPDVAVPHALNDTVDSVQLWQTLNEFTEADFILAQIARNLGGLDLNQAGELNVHEKEKDEFSDYAVIYRTHGMSRILQQRFKDSGIPFQVIGGNSILSDKTLNFLCLLYGYLFSRSGKDFANLLQSKIVALSDRGVERISRIKEENLFASVKTMYLQKQLTQKKLGKLLQLIESFAEVTDPQAIISEAINTFDLHAAVDELNLRNNAFDEFEMLVSRFETVAGFAEHLVELAENGYYDEYSNKVTLLTMHAAKGLEFKNVFICGFEDGIIPFTKFERSEEELLEEKRLLYVAMTRARNNLYLLSARERMRLKAEPSRFWNLIKGDNVNVLEDAAIKKYEKKRKATKAKKSQLKLI
ncbi:MAG TPA: ATP-dependent helicase [Patescibacteria group bacterium]|nr:ATP-dependent helicase [Patescibacteria group bacterium]